MANWQHKVATLHFILGILNHLDNRMIVHEFGDRYDDIQHCLHSSSGVLAGRCW